MYRSLGYKPEQDLSPAQEFSAQRQVQAREMWSLQARMCREWVSGIVSRRMLVSRSCPDRPVVTCRALWRAWFPVCKAQTLPGATHSCRHGDRGMPHKTPLKWLDQASCLQKAP